jgi:alginate O-acetyltransferase complex protein AlgI
MVFSSHIFLFYFLPLVLLLNYTLPFRWLSLTLTLLSYAFYGWANPAWVLLMLFSSYVDYFCGLALARFSGLPCDGPELPLLPRGQPRNRAQKAALTVSILSNLTILGYFKYFDFAAANVNALAQTLGLGGEALSLLHVALPVGVSFYTFESMSYAIDVYRGDGRPLRNPIDFQLFVALFPHLVAGPVVRYHTMAEQIRRRTFSYEKFARGVAFFSLGMAKKVLLANPMGHVADAAFNAGALRCGDAWYGLVAYAFQIYFDFSGYSDMAVGLALMLGFLIIKNFDSPYRALSLTDFWRRWHISLSTWLRDYLYIPLGGNRRGGWRTHANLMTVMLLGGLWHGASWNFAVWGGIHGAVLAFERLRAGRRGRLPAPVCGALTFAVVCLAWVFFRAETLPQALGYLGSLFGLAGAGLPAELVAPALYAPYHVLVFVLCGLVVWGGKQAWTFTRRLSPAKATLCLGLLMLSLMFLWTQSVNPFLYFQF